MGYGMTRTPTGWVVEDQRDDYMLYSREVGNVVVILCMDKEKKSAEVSVETIKADGMTEGTDAGAFTWETALHMLGLKEEQLYDRN